VLTNISLGTLHVPGLGGIDRAYVHRVNQYSLSFKPAEHQLVDKRRNYATVAQDIPNITSNDVE